VCIQVPQMSVSVFVSGDFKFTDRVNIKANLNDIDFFRLFHTDQPTSVIIWEMLTLEIGQWLISA
jgi:hypothetical protein